MPIAGSREVAALIESKRRGRARRIGVDGKRLWYVLHGQREMRVDELVKLCAFFDLGLGRFIDRATVEQLRSPYPFRQE